MTLSRPALLAALTSLLWVLAPGLAAAEPPAAPQGPKAGPAPAAAKTAAKPSPGAAPADKPGAGTKLLPLMVQMQEEMLKRRREALRNEAGLTETETTTAEKIFDKYRDLRKDAAQKIRRARLDLQALLAQPTKKDKDVTAAIDALLAARTAHSALDKEEVDALRKDLPVTKHARLISDIGRWRRALLKGKKDKEANQIKPGLKQKLMSLPPPKTAK